MGNANSSVDSTELSSKSGSSVDRDTDYYDILVLGRTGMGKSSTVDKLMPFQANQDKEQIIVETNRTIIKYKNIKVTLNSSDTEEIQKTIARVEMIMGKSNWSNSFDKENDILQGVNIQNGMYKSSRSCQLLENINLKIRILDPPGFYRYDLMEGAINTSDSNLIIVKQIFHMQVIERLKFSRILYFLPQNGPLMRSEQALLEEIQQLVKFFGESVFRHMVLVATMPPHISRDSDFTSERKFPQKLLDQSTKFFQEMLVAVFTKQRNTNTSVPPHPPIIFIAMTDTGEEILEKIRTAPVESENPFQLEFSNNTCKKCGIKIGINKDNVKVCEYQKANDVPWANAVLYDETYCHPEFAATELTWSFEELCIQCNQIPGSKGCMKLNEKIKHNNETLMVSHSN